MRRALVLIISIILILGSIIICWDPYLVLPEIHDVRLVAWEDKVPATEPKALIQFTFASKVAFTTNYPIHAKVEIRFRKDVNYTKVIVHILRSPTEYSYKYPVGKIPDAGWIHISEYGYPRTGELDIEFPSPGSYGFYIIEEMKVAYVATDKTIITISPYENRLTIELAIRGLGFSIVSINIGILGLPILQKSRKTKQVISSRRRP